MRSDDGCHGGQRHQRIKRPGRGEQVKGIFDGRRVGKQQRPLAEIIEQQGGQDDGKPGRADWRPSEVPHVGVKRLATGQHQHDPSERKKADQRVVHEKGDRPARIQRSQHVGIADDAVDAEDGQGGEPQQHHRPEQLADTRRAVVLDEKQKNQDHQRQRNDERLEGRGDDFQPFDCGEHRNRRRDHSVAVEKCRADQPEHDDGCPFRPFLTMAQGQRHQRHDAALATIVGAHDEGDVLAADHGHQHPENQREDAEHVIGADRYGVVCAAKDFLQRIQRTGADVAKNHAQRGKRQCTST